MGVYINGMEMPKFGGKIITIYADGRVLYDGGYIKAVHVPPHGSLIEKHDVFKLITAFPEVDKLLPVEFMEALYNLPTIIPAEPEKPRELVWREWNYIVPKEDGE